MRNIQYCLLAGLVLMALLFATLEDEERKAEDQAEVAIDMLNFNMGHSPT
ncbi:hypothetical protein RvY_18831 [Ramazzottius varieornatus]|uniref:Uncharacterized protein n=1 Tax=Ramazzottius varieornatus TaxID=947166 RepID=A0A1D1W779_RAMVA|nr:hypothetical protein RvY_18831 [Ramazzottius varieornatus]